MMTHKLISDIAASLPEAKIRVYTHSMGASVALNALSNINDSLPNPVVDRLILLSPDIDYTEYYRLLDQVEQRCGQAHIYTSRQNMALYLSNVIRNRDNDQFEARLGFGDLPEIYNQRGFVELLDFQLNDVAINHSFFLDEPYVSDLKALARAKLLSIVDIRRRSLDETLLKHKLFDNRKNTFQVSAI